MSTNKESQRTNTETGPKIPQTPAQAVSQHLPAIMSVNNALQKLHNTHGITDAEYNKGMKAILKEKPVAGQEFIAAELEQYSAETEQAIAVIDKRLEEIGEAASAEHKLQYNMRKNVLLNNLSKAKKQSEIAINQLKAIPTPINESIPIGIPKVLDTNTVPPTLEIGETGHQMARYIPDSTPLSPSTNPVDIHRKVRNEDEVVIDVTEPKIKQVKREKKGGLKAGIANLFGRAKRSNENTLIPSTAESIEQDLVIKPEHFAIITGQDNQSPKTKSRIDQMVSNIQDRRNEGSTQPENTVIAAPDISQGMSNLSRDIDHVEELIKTTVAQRASKSEPKPSALYGLVNNVKGKIEGLGIGAKLTPELTALKESIKAQENQISILKRRYNDIRSMSDQRSSVNMAELSRLRLSIKNLTTKLEGDQKSLKYGIKDRVDLSKDKNVFGGISVEVLIEEHKVARAVLVRDLDILKQKNYLSTRGNNNGLIERKIKQIKKLDDKFKLDIKRSSGNI
jgi:hypothetical protein